MPWARKDRPSAAIAALSSYVRRERPEDDVRVFNEFLSTASTLGSPLYDALLDSSPRCSELLHLALYYPEKRTSVYTVFLDWIEKEKPFDRTELENGPVGRSGNADRFDWLLARLSERLEALVSSLIDFDVVGFSVAYSNQIFPSLLAARRLKEQSARMTVVLGGAALCTGVGPSLLKAFPALDFIVQGEGERPLLAILDGLDAPSQLARQPGILCRSNVDQHPRGAEPCEVEDLNDLPIPQFDEYAQAAEEMQIGWVLPIEGSRGCWWNCTQRSSNARRTCYFCNENVLWRGYREKSDKRIAEEFLSLSDRYRLLYFNFTDLVMRHHGIVELADAIKGHGRDFLFDYDLRASVRPHELLALYEAGLKQCLFGIEGLATRYLKRIGKGTTTMRNLQVLRLCAELRIHHESRLVTEFPGSTVDDVEETRRNLLDYALGYEPVQASPFALLLGSTVETLRADFGISAVQTEAMYRAGLPETVLQRITLPDVCFETQAPRVSWQPVMDAIDHWKKVHVEGLGRAMPLLYYQDGGSFLFISDDRFGDHREGIYEGLAREVYLDCLEIRGIEVLKRRFPKVGEAEILEVCAEFVASRLMFEEDRHFLSLALATGPELAARRIHTALRARTGGLEKV